MTKDELEQDNDPFTFTTLGAATLNVVRWLEKDRDQAPDREADKTPEKEAERQREHDRAVESGMRQIERFERRYLRNRT